MSLRWEQSTIEWQLRDYEMWRGTTAAGRMVAQVGAQWRDGAWSWAGYYWGDRPPELPVLTFGRDRSLVGEGWATAAEAMQAVDERHAATQ